MKCFAQARPYEMTTVTEISTFKAVKTKIGFKTKISLLGFTIINSS